MSWCSRKCFSGKSKALNDVEEVTGTTAGVRGFQVRKEKIEFPAGGMIVTQKHEFLQVQSKNILAFFL